MPHFYTWFCCWIFCWYAPYLGAQHPYCKALAKSDGLPSDEVFYLHQDRWGLMWIGCDAGLFRYDGNQFQPFTNAAQSGISMSHILEDTKNNRIWCQNFNGQLFYVQDDSLYLARDCSQEYPSFPPFTLDKNGVAYYTGLDGVYRLDVDKKEHSFIRLFPKDSLVRPIFDVFASPTGDVYAYGPNSFFRWQTNQITPITKTNRPDVWLLLSGQRGKFYAFHNQVFLFSELNNVPPTRRYFVSTLRNDSLIVLGEIPYNMTNGRINSFDVDSLGNYKLATQNGLVFTDSNFRPLYRDTSFLRQRNVSDIIQDKEGNYWAATLDAGIMLIPNLQIWQLTPANSPLLHLKIQSICAIDTQRLAIGFFKGDIQLLNLETKQSQLLTPSEHAFRAVSCLRWDSAAQILRASQGMFTENQLQKNKPRIFTYVANVRKFTPLIGDSIYYVASDALGIFAPNGKTDQFRNLIRKKAGRTLSYNTHYQRLWVSFSDGVMHKTPSDTLRYFYINGQKIYAQCMTTDAAGITWIGTMSDGLWGIKDTTIYKHFSTHNGLKTSIIRSIFADENDLWLATNNAVYRIDLQSFEIQCLDQHDGLPTLEVSNIATLGNYIILATQDGIFYFPKDIATAPLYRPHIQLIRIEFNDNTLPITEQKLELNYNRQNKLIIHFQGIGFRNPKAFIYKYRLLGLDTTWNTTSIASPYTKYASLPAGEYTFEVKAIAEEGYESPIPARFEFVIHAPYWQKWWFYLLVALAGAGLVSVVFLWRIRYLNHQNDIRLQLQSSQLTALKAQMNPHFMFNALNSIQDFILRQDVKNANLFLSKFSDLTRRILDASGKQHISLEEETRILKLYIELEQARFNDDFSFELLIDEALDSETTYIASMLVQPFIENAVKHGLLHKKGQKHLSVQFQKYSETHLQCTIQDNGIGRTKSAEIQERKKRFSQSFATEATRRRLDLLNSANLKQISLNIFDLINENSEPLGTKVVILLPYESK